MVKLVPSKPSEAARTVFRRATALVLAFTFTVSTAESVMGAVYDGEAHHETDAAAIEHQIEQGTTHADEEKAPAGDEHAHGSAADHCTHQHSVPLPASATRADMIADQLAPLDSPPVGPLSRSIEALFRPPRA